MGAPGILQGCIRNFLKGAEATGGRGGGTEVESRGKAPVRSLGTKSPRRLSKM